MFLDTQKDTVLDSMDGVSKYGFPITQWMGEDVGQFGLSSPPDWHRLTPAGQLLTNT